MARRSRSSGKGPLWRGYRRPVWRDGVFWLALGTSIAGLVMQNAFGNFEATTRGWLILGLEVVITFAIVFALIGVLAGTLRGFGEGWRQAENDAAPGRSTAGIAATEAAPAPSPEPTAAARPEPAAPEPVAADSDPVAARAEAEEATEASERIDAGPAPIRPAPDPAGRPRAGVEMEKQARRLGRAIAAGRRTYKKYDEN